MTDAVVAREWQPPVQMGASAHMDALRPFHFDCEWTGKVAAVDNNGSSALLRGYIDGSRFVIEVLGDGPVQNRMQWKLLDGGHVAWRNDCSINGGPWQLVEEYACTPVKM